MSRPHERSGDTDHRVHDPCIFTSARDTMGGLVNSESNYLIPIQQVLKSAIPIGVTCLTGVGMLGP